MKIPFVLNDESVTVEVHPSTRLVQVLREHFSLTGTKEGCLQGHCGSCLVFVNRRLVPSCMMPAFTVYNARVLTIEGFAHTQEFRDIEKGFLLSGVSPCGFCASSTVLIAHSVLVDGSNPTEERIRTALSNLRCRCTAYSSLIKGIKAASEIRRNRTHGRNR
jgi:aerobic carbon-monoxide dehydrogenase small subunit